MKLGVEAFARALLTIPKTLATNSGFELVPTMLKLEEEHKKGHIVGLDLTTGEPMDPAQEGIFDTVGVKKQFLEASTIVASQLLLVDEVLKAGKASTQ